MEVAGALHLAHRALADRHRNPSGASIGRRVFIDHGMGVVIGETAEISDDCTLYHGVTLVAPRGTRQAPSHPDARRGGGRGARSRPITIGAGARVGSNAVVVKDVPDNATAVASRHASWTAQRKSSATSRRKSSASRRMPFRPT